MIGPHEEMQPNLGNGEWEPEWIVISDATFAWAYTAKQYRLILKKYLNRDSIPCENCHTSMVRGDRALLMHYKGEGNQNQNVNKSRIFCGVPCQRQNYTPPAKFYMGPGRRRS